MNVFVVETTKFARHIRKACVEDRIALGFLPEPKKCAPLIPGLASIFFSFANDGMALLYAVSSSGEVIVYRRPLKDGQFCRACPNGPQSSIRFPSGLWWECLPFRGIFRRLFSRDQAAKPTFTS